MSKRYPGGYLTASPVVPTSTAAPGVWTLEQQYQANGAGNWPAAANYQINKSLRFRSSASAYLNRTPAVTSNRQTWTWSGWVKRGNLDTYNTIMGSNISSSGGYTTVFAALRFTDANVLSAFEYDINTNTTFYRFDTTQVFRDPAAWYHIVFAFDSTQATSTNRWKLYVNGTQVTAFSSTTYPSQNYSTLQNTASIQEQIGLGYTNYLDGYQAEINFIDGVALTPSSFGTTDAYGIWQPIPYSGSYGTNGFYLPFTNTTSTTTLGYDSSGNGNNWTTNNISLTAGTTYDSMNDSPTNNSSTVANYAVLNPLTTPPSGYSSNGSVISGNLQYTTSGVSIKKATMAFPTSGKWYVECRSSGTSPSIDWIFGLTGMDAATPVNHSNPGVNLYVSDTAYWLLNAATQFTQAGAISSSDVFQIAYDSSTGEVWLGKNNTYYTSAGSGTGNPSSGTNEFGTLSTSTVFCAYTGSNSSSMTSSINFGQQPFVYTAPTGFLPLNTYNLPNSNVPVGNRVMDATLISANQSTQVIVNAGAFKPDMVWLKSRSNANNHTLYDSTRGVNNPLYPNLTNAQGSGSGLLTAFNSNGFTLGANENANDQAGETSVGWQWQAGQGTTSSNTNGSITSTVSVNPTAGFSVVQFTATGSNATVGHGLGAAPAMVIVKDAASVGNWAVYHKSLPSAAYYLYLNTTATQGNTAQIWNSTAPTSSVFSIGTWHTADGQIAYCWAPVAGYSAFGSYVGNGSSDGPFIYTGFQPKFIMFQCATAGSNWTTVDTARSPYNPVTLALLPNDSRAETSYANYDIVSNGFKIRGSLGNEYNVSGQTYIYACFAESPFKMARAR